MNQEDVLQPLRKDLQQAKVARQQTLFARPVFLILAYMLVAYALVFAYSDFLVSITGQTPTLLRGLATEVRFSLSLGAIFWLCHRVHFVSTSERIVPLFCVFQCIVMELRLDRVVQEYDTAFAWALTYRYGAVAILFWIAHRSFRLSIQPLKLNEPTRPLNLRGILAAVLLIALLLGWDSLFRGRAEAIGRSQNVSGPPWLALAFAVSRASLWIGVALTVSQSGRFGVLLGLGFNLFWLMARGAIVLYLSLVLYPSLQAGLPMRVYPSLDEMLVIQIVQFLFAWMVVAMILVVGYRFRVAIGNETPRIEEQGELTFDSIT